MNIKTAIEELQIRLKVSEGLLNVEFKNRHEFMYDFNDIETYNMFRVMIENVRNYRKCIHLLNY